jgi:hypothetical protein
VGVYQQSIFDPSYGALITAAPGGSVEADYEDANVVDIWDGVWVNGNSTKMDPAHWNPHTQGKKDLKFVP